MINITHAHGLATQILCAYLQSGKGLVLSGDAEGERTGRYLAGIYRELLRSLVSVEPEGTPAKK
jgi:hypothetical protein